MKKYQVVVDNESAEVLFELLHSLPCVKEVKSADVSDAYTIASQEALSEDWLSEDDDELQRMYSK
jgi:hypothetical protein